VLAGVCIRTGRDDDAAGLIGLIGDCFAEYPGCVLDVDGEMPYLRGIASYYAACDGRVWIGEQGSRVVASIAMQPGVRGAIELRMLYVAKPARRRGLASRLCEHVEAEARARGAAAIELWSDTRFLDAHRLYSRLGYLRGPRTRELHDLSNTVEYYFRKPLATGA
jgi:putative acetyltransferase